MALKSRRSYQQVAEPVRYGVVGLGWFAQTAILPAFQHAKDNSALVALFSSDATKLNELGEEYGVGDLHSYDELESRLAQHDIDAVYIAVPNDLHREFTERVAGAGVHVLCEKPMAVTEEECHAMIRATEAADVKLMIAYRLHFEAANLKAIDMINDGAIGEPRLFSSVFANQVTDVDNIRLNPTAKGGGTLYDIGIYCINAARYVFRSEPTEVMARSETPSGRGGRFRECDEMTSAILRFPGDRLASITTSFGAADHDFYQVFGTQGSLRVEPAYDFSLPLAHCLRSGGETSTEKFAHRDQVAPELLYFSHCILEDETPEPSGEEGLADVRIIQALLRSAETGQAVQLEPFTRRHRPGLEQEIHRPPPDEAELVKAEPPGS